METKQKSILIATIILLVGFSIWWYQGYRVDKSKETIAVQSIGTIEDMNTSDSDSASQPAERNPVAAFETTKGIIEIELFLDKTTITARNFIKLAESGFYDNTKFHRVIKGFMIQGGDPNSKGSDASQYGFGGPGYTIQDEFVNGLSNVRGTISMANIGKPNTGGSQFFINQVDNIGLDFDKPPLTSSHPVFGRVIRGMDIVDAIANTLTDQNGVPKTPISIKHIRITY